MNEQDILDIFGSSIQTPSNEKEIQTEDRLKSRYETLETYQSPDEESDEDDDLLFLPQTKEAALYAEKEKAAGVALVSKRYMGDEKALMRKEVLGLKTIMVEVKDIVVELRKKYV